MARRFFRKLPRRTLQVVGGLLLLGVAVFFGLTRTQVGRRQLKERIEAQFDARFAGHLHIERLTGTLIGTVYARGVRLDGPGGRRVLSVDSVRAVPRWRSLFGREVFFRNVELVGARLRLARSDSGSWNLARAFRRTTPRDSRRDPFALRFADVTLRHADLRTENNGRTPRLVRKNWLFDYTNAHLADVDARLSVERTPGGGLQIGLHHLEGRLASLGVPIEAARSQVAVSDGSVALRRLRLDLGRTRLGGSFAIDATSGGAEPTLRLNLSESRLDHDQIRRLVPRWPLRGTTTAALEARGPLDRLRVRSLRLARGASTLQAKGTLRGLPGDVIFDLNFADSRLTAADLRAVVPGLPPQQLARLARFGTARFDLGLEGRLAGLSGGTRRLRASARFDVQTDAGALRGTADVSRRRGRPLTYSAEVHASDFQAGRLGRASTLPSRLTGTLTLSGSGTSAQAVAGTLEARLERSVVAGRALNGLDVDLHAAGEGRLTGTATLRPPRGGPLYVSGTVDRSGPVPAYDLTARARRFDLGRLLGRDSLATALTGTAKIDGRGTSLGALAGHLRLALDSSSVTRGSRAARALPPFTAALTLAAPQEAGPRIVLRSDFADLTVHGEADLAALRAAGQLWGRAFAGAAREAYHKPYAGRGGAGPSTTEPGAAPAPGAKQAVRRALDAAGLGRALDLKAEGALTRPALLHRLLPAFPALHDTLTLRAALQVGAESLSASGAVQVERLQAGRLRATNVESQFRAQASLAAPLLETLDASFDASAGTLGLGTARFHAPVLAASYRKRAGDVQLSTSAGGGSERLQLSTGVRLLPDRNRLRIRTLRLADDDYAWQNAASPPVDLYADAVVVPGLTLVSRSSAGAQPQRVTLHGVLSAAPTDTLSANIDQVRLRPLARVAGLNHRLGGRLDAQINWTGGTHTPELTGRLDVARLAFENHLLGRLTAHSEYVPGTPRIAFDTRLRPENENDSPDGETRALQIEENRLSARGTVALPGLRSAENDPGSEAGALDLDLDVGRADLFFFDYLFDGKVTNAAGALAGTGHIGGSFHDPLFQADLQLSGGSFRVPRYGLRYGAEGGVGVDREGIKVERVRLTDPHDGSATVQGALLFNGYDHFSFDLSAALDELQIIDVKNSRDLPFYGQIAASGPLRLTGPLNDARLTSDRVRTTPESQLILPIEEDDASESESGFLIFADSTGRLPNLHEATRRENILDERPAGERSFVDGLELDLGITAPPGSTVRLVFDPLLGDEIVAVGGGQIQLLREGGDLSLYGNFDVDSGRYLFTAGQVFQRRFQIDEGTLRWDGPAANALIDLTATYRTRASRAGLPGARENATGRIPILVQLDIDGRVQRPSVDLSLAVDQSQRGFSDYSTAGLETVLNSDERGSEYATSVLLTNTFLLTTDLAGRKNQGLSETSNRLAFNSVSQLVSSQLNRYLDEALPGLDVNLGVQGEDPQNLDVIYGVALRLLDERLVIRGEGVFDGPAGQEQNQSNGFEGEFTVEVRLTPRVSVEAFYRREGSLLSDRALTSTTGAGLSYQTEFPTWKKLWVRLFGWLGADDPDGANEEAPPQNDAVASGKGTGFVDEGGGDSR